MLGLESETGRKAFLWAAETRDKSRFKYKAEEYAHEVESLCGFNEAVAPALAQICDDNEVLSDLYKFVLKRHANWRFGGNIQMWWET